MLTEEGLPTPIGPIPPPHPHAPIPRHTKVEAGSKMAMGAQDGKEAYPNLVVDRGALERHLPEPLLHSFQPGQLRLQDGTIFASMSQMS
jgi:hypothetical protein